jgi:hypothetical protein
VRGADRDRRLPGRLSLHVRPYRGERTGEPNADAREYTRDDASAYRNSCRVDADPDRGGDRDAPHRDPDVRSRFHACHVHADAGSRDALAGSRDADGDARPADPDADTLRGHANAHAVRRNSDGDTHADADIHADRDAYPDAFPDALRVRSRRRSRRRSRERPPRGRARR